MSLYWQSYTYVFDIFPKFISSNEVEYKCLEMDLVTQQQCNFTSKESEDIFKHRSKHKIRDSGIPAIKPEVNIE